MRADRGGAVPIQIRDHLALAQRAAITAPGVVGIDGDDRTQQPGGKLAGGQPISQRHQMRADRFDPRGVEPAHGRVEVIGEHPCPGSIDPPGPQRREHPR